MSNMWSQAKDNVFNLLVIGDKRNRAVRITDNILIVLIVVSTVIVIGDTFNSAPPQYRTFSTVAEPVITITFTVEYILRLWVANKDKGRLRFVFSPMAIVDLVAILPFYIGLIFPVSITALRVLRVLRLVRLLRIGRYTKALDVVTYVLKRKVGQLVASFAVIGLLLIVASTLMYVAEQGSLKDPFTNALSGLYWAMITITTVGYGDFVPVTIAGRIIAVFVALLGVGLVAVPTGIISSGFTEYATQSERGKTGRGSSRHPTSFATDDRIARLTLSSRARARVISRRQQAKFGTKASGAS